MPKQEKLPLLHRPRRLRQGPYTVLSVLTLVIMLGFSSLASAQMLQDQGPPGRRFFWTTFVAARVNPIGIGSFSTLRMRQRLYQSDSVALRNNYVGLGLMLGLNPVRTRLGVLAEVSPLTPLRFWASLEAMVWQPILGVRSDKNAQSEWNDSIVGELLSGQNTSYGTLGVYATLGVDAQIKIGPIAFRAFGKAVRTDIYARDGDRVFYDANLDLQMPVHGWTLNSDVDVLYILGPFILGIRSTVTQPLYDDETLGLGRSPTLLERFWNENGPAARIGPLVAWKIFSNDGAIFNGPTLAMIVQWHLHHRYRSGADAQLFVPSPFSAAVPYVAIAFTGFGDLLDVK